METPKTYKLIAGKINEISTANNELRPKKGQSFKPIFVSAPNEKGEFVVILESY
ncbi:MAG: hypothetical protein LAO31_05545 [Acidobacteriia bacterium]|nr:hypothetical protein [Terriglobia bacterium]